jgi:Zn finger protein HypA/HybF involved in hydrogenase expression
MPLDGVLSNIELGIAELIVWCKTCQHQVEPDPAEMTARHGAETSVLDWRERLICSRCGSREIDGRDRKGVISRSPIEACWFSTGCWKFPE